MNKEKINFGDIFTNGIKYWIVTGAWVKTVCECGCEELKYELMPVIMEKGKPKYISWERCNIQIEDIKPYAIFCGSLEFNHKR